MELNSIDSNSDFEGTIDLSEDILYKRKRKNRRAKETKHRHSAKRLEKYARVKQTPSQHNAMSIAIQDYVKLLIGVQRKGRTVKSCGTLPDPPSAEECLAWEQRRLAKRKYIEKAMNIARERYLQTHSSAKEKHIFMVEANAAEEANSKIQPIDFLSRVPLRNPRLKYSIQEAKTCEAALALAGFSRCTFDWHSPLKTTWNKAVSTLILQQWDKCYRRGGADEYAIDTHLVTPENEFLILERWYENRRQKYSSNLHEETMIAENPAREHELQVKKLSLREKGARTRSRKRVSLFINTTIVHIDYVAYNSNVIEGL